MSAPAAPAGEAKEVKPQAPVAAPADQVKQQNKKEKKEKKEKKGGISELNPPPEYFEERIKIFDEYMAKYQDFVAKQPRDAITVTLPDGKQIQGTAWETTPLEIAKGISSSLADRTVIAKVNNQQLWDLTRPLEGSCNLALLDFDSPEGDYEARQVFWHSSAHVMGEACERSFEGCCLGYGPPLPEGGFFYDMSLGNDRTIGQDDYKQIEEISKKAVKEKQAFQRLELPKEVLLQMFKYNKYKQHYINEKVPDGTSSTVYRCGPLIDLCLGPHVPHTGRIKSLAVTKNSSSYFLGDAKNDSFQRVYGMSFPDSKQMTEWKKLQEEAAKRDHRKIAKDQELFFFSDLSPGSPFMLPHGMRIYNTLMKFIREEYHKRGFVEVGSPNMFNSKLWETSGHWQHYAKDMFTLKVEEDTFALKPMNCPGHCVIFDSRDRSYKELPLRLAEFGVLHRNEASGALSGMTRVRRFVQDDGELLLPGFAETDLQRTSSVPSTRSRRSCTRPSTSSTPSTSPSASSTRSVFRPATRRSGWVTLPFGTRPRPRSRTFWRRRCPESGTLTRRTPRSTAPSSTSTSWTRSAASGSAVRSSSTSSCPSASTCSTVVLRRPRPTSRLRLASCSPATTAR